MKPLRVWLVLFGLLSFGASALRADDRSIRDSLPTGELKDEAGFLSPDAQARVLIRLEQFTSAGAPRGSAHRPNDIQLHVYTLKSAGLKSPDRKIEDLYRSWRSVTRSQGDTFEREVILFVFLAERQARVVSGEQIPPDIQAAVKGIQPDLPSIFTGQPEQALLAVIDRLAELVEVPATYRDPPPVPSDPGPIFGRWRWSESVREALVQAIGRASAQAGRLIVLAGDPELNYLPRAPERRSPAVSFAKARALPARDGCALALREAPDLSPPRHGS